MASISHPALLDTAAKKIGLKVTDVSLKKDRSKILIQGNGKMYIASENHVYPNIPLWIRKFMNDKLLSQNVLTRLGYNTIPSHDCNPKDFANEKTFVTHTAKHTLTYPVITKTNTGTYGLGVTFIANQKELEVTAKKLFKKRKRFMVQPILWDDEYRITLIEKKPIMVHKKRLPHVIGDGSQKITDLLSQQSIVLRDKNFIAWNLKRHNYTHNTVLPAGTVFETHIIKKRTPEYYVTSRFPKTVVAWGKQLLSDVSARTVAIDFTAPKGLDVPKKFVIFEINANPHWNYVIDELDDTETPQKISAHILTSYFGVPKK